ncbi:MAG TPA: hypothetical protein H9741_00055 [Candidatus Borkfalkia faecipullorum]|uniref:histidine kinase n=1 Tax=Candidatus Borkfalkia faecipullorum TaxID=2838510 RepID=A0A9D1V669_9FIRM|nr:hypothetical protein [Candidatus Borkfalkia faecipullorum]
MRKRILLVTLLVSVVGVLFLSILFSAVFYGQTVERTFSELKIYMNVYEAGYASLPPDEEQAQALSEELGGARVTFLSETGEVLADTGGAEDNHVTREEVQQALLTGEGRSVRTSATLRESMLYYCRAFEQGDTLLLVRLAVPARSGLAIFAESLPTVVWFLVVDILCCLFVAWLATSFVLRPVEQLTQEAALSGGKEVRTKYAELAPIAKMINLMNADLHEKVEKMNEDRRLEKLILNSIEHGIVIFRDPSDVILINRTAKRLLDYEVNEPVPCFVNDREIVAVLEAGENAALVRKINGRYYSFRFTFNEKSRVLLITDVTETTAAAISKNDFIANVTHEMNTPLTSIRGFAELIGAGTMPPDKLKGAADTIIRQSDRLANLIRSIINFSAIDSDELPDYEVDLSELLREIVASFEPKIAEKKISLTFEAEEGVKVLSRRERLLEIINNLVSNGIRYNKEGGALKILLSGGDCPKLVVADTGIGIAEEDKSRIFDRFYTVDKSHNGAGGGFGLGLAIVKKLCRRAGWQLSVESELGKGTAFTILFSAQKK